MLLLVNMLCASPKTTLSTAECLCTRYCPAAGTPHTLYLLCHGSLSTADCAEAKLQQSTVPSVLSIICIPALCGFKCTHSTGMALGTGGRGCAPFPRRALWSDGAPVPVCNPVEAVKRLSDPRSQALFRVAMLLTVNPNAGKHTVSCRQREAVHGVRRAFPRSSGSRAASRLTRLPSAPHQQFSAP